MTRAAGLLAPLAIAGALAAFGAEGAWAYSCVAGSCPAYCESPVSFRLHTPSQDLGLQSTEAELKKGMASWTQPSCSSLKVQYGGTTTQLPESGNGVVTWEEENWSSGSGTIGVTTTRLSGGCITSHMVMNGVNFRWVTGAPASRGDVHAVTIIAHEGGHYVGLGHSSEAGAVMAAQYRGGMVPLNDDDAAGICKVYPGGGGMAAESPAGAGGMAGGSGGGGMGGNSMGAAGMAGKAGQSGQTPGAGMGSGGTSGGGCRSDSDCRGDQRCNTSHTCVTAGEDKILVADGERCDVNQDCRSQLCLELGKQSLCSRLCTSNADCVSGFGCREQGNEKLCSPIGDDSSPSNDFTNDNPVRGGCSLAGPAGSESGMALFALLGLVLTGIGIRRRKPKAGWLWGGFVVLLFLGGLQNLGCGGGVVGEADDSGDDDDDRVGGAGGSGTSTGGAGAPSKAGGRGGKPGAGNSGGTSSGGGGNTVGAGGNASGGTGGNAAGMSGNPAGGAAGSPPAQTAGCSTTFPGATGKEPNGQIPVCCTPAASDKAMIQEVFRLLNEHRVANGRSALTYDVKLEQTIQAHCQHMAEHTFFAHDAPESQVSAFTARAKACGVSASGENIAYNQRDANQVMTSWKNSPGHNANMLEPAYTRVGIGQYQLRWGQIFGR